MNKQEIRQQIQEIKARHHAELSALEAKLNEPEKWEPKGGEYRVRTVSDGHVFDSGFDGDVLSGELMIRTQTEKEGKDLASHLKRQAILWQLANDLNEGWEPDWSDGKWGKWCVYFEHHENHWDWNEKASCEVPTVYFKDEETAKKACEILNSQPELMR